MVNFVDLKEAEVGPTRGTRSIDGTFTNFGDQIRSAATIPPLGADNPEEGRPSDHRIAVVTATLPRVDAYRWLKYSYRYYNEESVKKFKTWVTLQDWDSVITAKGSNAKAEAYQKLVDDAIARFFPLITVRRKTTDLPWVNSKARRMIRRQKAIFRKEGRSQAWKKLKKALDVLLGKRKKKYEESQKICLLATDAVRNFWKNC